MTLPRHRSSALFRLVRAKIRRLLFVVLLPTLLLGGRPASAEVQVESVLLNGQHGSLNVVPGSTVNLKISFSVTGPPLCPGCPSQVILALDALQLNCLYDGVPAEPEERREVETTFELPPEPGVFTLYAVFEEEDDCEQALERYRQIGTHDPDRPRTSIGTIVAAPASVEIQLSKYVYEPGELVEGQVVSIAKAAASVISEVTFFDETKPQDDGAIVASFTTGGAQDLPGGQPLTLGFAFNAPAQPLIIDVNASLRSGDTVLGQAHARIGVRGPELRTVPPEILGGEVVTLNATNLLATLQAGSAGGTPVEVLLGSHRVVVKVREEQVFADPATIPAELQDAHAFIGVTTDDGGMENPGSVVTFAANATANLVSASIRELEDPEAPVSTQRSLWVETMAQYDETLDPQGGAHLIYRLSDTVASAAVGKDHGEPSTGDEVSLIPGDTNKDGKVDISDPVRLLGYLFLGSDLDPCYLGHDSSSPSPAGLAVVDWNGDTRYDLSDAVGALTYLFSSGAPHALGKDCRQFTDASCSSTCTPEQGNAGGDEGTGGATAVSAYIPVAIYEHFDNYLTTWRRYNIFLNWRSTVLAEFRNVPRRQAPYDSVTVQDVGLWAWGYLGRDGYGSDCSQVLEKFKTDNPTPYKALHVLFTNQGNTSCGGKAYLARSSDFLYSIVEQNAFISEAYETMVLSQETGHNLDYHEAPFPHDAHLDGGISESWWHDHGWWFFTNWQLHCTAMMGSYGGCSEPEMRYHNSSIDPLRHLAEGIYQAFRP
jgi:hypothetical protein